MAAQLTVKVSGIVQASPQRVFDAMTDPEQVARWWGPEGFICPAVSLDPRVGGAYRIAMQPPEGELFHLAGEYLEVDPPSRLAYTFRWEPPNPDDRETVARLVLHERDGATEVELTQGTFTTEVATRAAQGRLDRHSRSPSQPSRVGLIDFANAARPGPAAFRCHSRRQRPQPWHR